MRGEIQAIYIPVAKVHHQIFLAYSPTDYTPPSVWPILMQIEKLPTPNKKVGIFQNVSYVCYTLHSPYTNNMPYSDVMECTILHLGAYGPSAFTQELLIINQMTETYTNRFMAET